MLRSKRCRLERWLDADDRKIWMLGTKRRRRDRGRCIAGNDNGLAAFMHHVFHYGTGELHDLFVRLLSIRCIRRVPKEEEALMRKLAHEMLEHADAADARIEDADPSLMLSHGTHDLPSARA